MQPGGESYALWDVNYSNLPDWYSGQGGYGILEKLSPAEVVELWENSVASGEYVKADTVEGLFKNWACPPPKQKRALTATTNCAKQKLTATSSSDLKTFSLLQHHPSTGIKHREGLDSSRFWVVCTPMTACASAMQMTTQLRDFITLGLWLVISILVSIPFKWKVLTTEPAA